MIATKGRPSAVRLRREFEERLEVEAQRTRRPRASVSEELGDEAVRMRRFPGIGFMGSERDRRACLLGTGLEVVLVYYRKYPEDVGWLVRENDRSAEEGHRN
jgi:hypothetical protein